ncbi:MAG: hypothetical protein QXK37_06370 [Candidatus Woesearchaeota archaeon]
MSIELVVFLASAMILLGVITVLVYDWKLKEDVNELKTLYTGEDEGRVFKVDKVRFFVEVLNFWEYCNHSFVNDTRRFYVYNTDDIKNGTINKKEMFDSYKALGLCKSIQSLNNSCGVREDVSISDIKLPSVVRLSCHNNTLFVE